MLVVLALVAKKLVVVALPAMSEDEYRFVEVELVVVLLRPVKFCSVDEPFAWIFVAVNFPVKVSLPPLAVVYERFVVDALVAYTLVEVLFVVVELTPVKFCKVVEPVTKRLAVVKRPLELMEPKVPVVAKKLVEVALLEVELSPVKFCKVVELLICS